MTDDLQPRRVTVSPDIVTLQQFVELRHLLPSEWSRQTQNEFLDGIIVAMIEFRYEPDGADLPPEKLKRQYEAIVKAGQVFLKAVLASPVVLWDRSDKNDKRMQRGAVPTRKLMMGAVLRVVTLQERLSEDAVSVIVGHHERPKVSIARTLCEHCVMAHFGVTKELPSGDPQTGWFVDFMHRVGELAGVTIGRNMVAAAIKRQRATG